MAYRCVPLYDTLGSDKIEYIINHAECKALALSGDKIPVVEAVLDKIRSNVKTVIYWGAKPEESSIKASPRFAQSRPTA